MPIVKSLILHTIQTKNCYQPGTLQREKLSHIWHQHSGKEKSTGKRKEKDLAWGCGPVIEPPYTHEALGFSPDNANTNPFPSPSQMRNRGYRQALALSPSTRRQAARFLSSRSAWFTQLAPGRPGHIDPVSSATKQNPVVSLRLRDERSSSKHTEEIQAYNGGIIYAGHSQPLLLQTPKDKMCSTMESTPKILLCGSLTIRVNKLQLHTMVYTRNPSIQEVEDGS